MNITEFHQLTDQLMSGVEQKLDQYIEELDKDIDYEMNGNVMTITFENRSKIIINTQEPLYQIWLATRKQGYHFDYKNNDWICDRSHVSFGEILDVAIKEQSA